ncbi:hypothetical protein A3F19_03385 [Candidatus Nomurabacteria bacterium RIFCSPHIGHO2_12_FULL_37_29]|uniref:AB hydrolase-1 domain-containing protein n=1 Tax=Candidatus Nomurabacteria bacterium RIFCSPHIGHO2_12_FULL_37_29 TaxID=1801759 RepID=A0A1F6WC66_9BACT|nr:MAG: hypothetical protein A2727_02470 [Candidatus Nomurabacteria bacterium RIFCSPHIGHO2_01_FULL_37_110]OGI79498.1 MAG: hypothetical protein A3F19_03385 [Candidatus Nomurabacteria bacterium RIFCSPHIGHO2_12_FULL_37_29]OGI85385.1 MAG: hypothetical protein A3A92_01625 [Candidatus Nomurabacteria bacterium RIFCSPLOWO2_01_FULL_37_49]
MNKLITWIKDYAHLFSGLIIAYSKRTPPKHYLEHIVHGKIPVIILPGVLMRWAFLKPIADHISLLGHPIYIIPKLGNNSENIPMSAERVRQVIEENNLKNVIIVAHSKGGLISKYLLLHEDPDKRIKGVIAIATPFHGSSISKFIPYSFIQELAINSNIIHHLANHPEVNKKIVSIIPSYDNHVWHPKGSYLEGAMQNINVEVAGHHKILRDKIVWDKVVEWIEKISRL